MSVNRVNSANSNYEIDKKYKSMDRTRKVASAALGAAWLGAGYLGAKSITKNENSALKEALAGASNFVLKHLNNGIKHIDKKEKLTKVTDLLQKAKNAPAKTKALVVFGAFIINGLLDVIKGSSYLKGALAQANNDEKIIRIQENIMDIDRKAELSRLNEQCGRNIQKMLNDINKTYEDR